MSITQRELEEEITSAKKYIERLNDRLKGLEPDQEDIREGTEQRINRAKEILTIKEKQLYEMIRLTSASAGSRRSRRTKKHSKKTKSRKHKKHRKSYRR
jgi:hypothetical protein